MQRITIVAPEQVLQRLRRMAAESGTSMDLIREARESKIATDHPRPRSPAMGASGYTGTAQPVGSERPLQRSWR
jgi:hypothetical protein